MRVEFQEELRQLEATIQEMGNLVLLAIRGGLNALEKDDTELADEVIAFDDEVDARARSVELQVEALLARQTPVARDLRLVLAILHINLHLERMADLCVNIAKIAKLAHRLGPREDEIPAMVLESFEEMGSRAEEMTRIALDSLADRDVQAAESLVDLDDLIDNGNTRTVSHLAKLDGDEQVREWSLLMVVVSRCLERLGDNAVDIGEQTAFLATGEFREFTDASHAP